MYRVVAYRLSRRLCTGRCYRGQWFIDWYTDGAEGGGTEGVGVEDGGAEGDGAEGGGVKGSGSHIVTNMVQRVVVSCTGTRCLIAMSDSLTLLSELYKQPGLYLLTVRVCSQNMVSSQHPRLCETKGRKTQGCLAWRELVKIPFHSTYRVQSTS